MRSNTVKHSGQLSSYRSSLASFSPSLNRFGGRGVENWSNLRFIDFISIRRIQPSSFFRRIILLHCRRIAFRWKISAPCNLFRWKMPPPTPFRRIVFFDQSSTARPRMPDVIEKMGPIIFRNTSDRENSHPTKMDSGCAWASISGDTVKAFLV